MCRVSPLVPSSARIPSPVVPQRQRRKSPQTAPSDESKLQPDRISNSSSLSSSSLEACQGQMDLAERQPTNKNLAGCQPTNKIRTRRRSEDRRIGWRRKPIADWSLDDLLLWLQHLRLDDVASILIGYDIDGSDVDKWNDEALRKKVTLCSVVN